jgi:phospholipid transport system substrate-binding protein
VIIAMPAPFASAGATGRRAVLALGATLALAMVMAPRQATAETSIDQATGFIDQTAQALMAAVNGSAAGPVKAAALEKIIEENVDIEAVARFCLGRFWRAATPVQQKEYLELFHRVLVTNITGRVGEYQGVSIVTNRGVARDDGVAVTTTVTRPNNAPNRVDWLVGGESGKLRVVDVIAEGTSLRLTQRNDYLSFLSRNNSNVQTLIDALRQQVAAPK